MNSKQVFEIGARPLPAYIGGLYTANTGMGRHGKQHRRTHGQTRRNDWRVCSTASADVRRCTNTPEPTATERSFRAVRAGRTSRAFPYPTRRSTTGWNSRGCGAVAARVPKSGNVARSTDLARRMWPSTMANLRGGLGLAEPRRFHHLQLPDAWLRDVAAPLGYGAWGDSKQLCQRRSAASQFDCVLRLHSKSDFSMLKANAQAH